MRRNPSPVFTPQAAGALEERDAFDLHRKPIVALRFESSRRATASVHGGHGASVREVPGRLSGQEVVGKKGAQAASGPYSRVEDTGELAQ
jgi:hypothetical protein